MSPVRILAAVVLHELFEVFTFGAANALGEKAADALSSWVEKQAHRRKPKKKPKRRSGTRRARTTFVKRRRQIGEVKQEQIICGPIADLDDPVVLARAEATYAGICTEEEAIEYRARHRVAVHVPVRSAGTTLPLARQRGASTKKTASTSASGDDDDGVRPSNQLAAVSRKSGGVA